LGKAGGVVGDPFLGDQLAVLVDDRDVVVGSAQSMPQKNFMVSIPPVTGGLCAGSTPEQDAQRSTYEARWPSLR
jgi:hypothetical protein